MKRDNVINAILSSVPGANLKKTDAGKVYNAVIDCIFEAIKAEDTVRLPGVGTLSVTTRKATTYRNPKTKELITKPPHKRIKFSISSTIKGAINS